MLTRLSANLATTYSACMAGLLALSAPACSTPREPAPAASWPSAAEAPPAGAARPPPPRAAAPASSPDVLKAALVAGWLWLDGTYVGRLERLDYVRLLAHVRERRARGRPGAAATLELEVDAQTDWQNAHYLLGLFDGYERLELVTAGGRFSLSIDAGRSSTAPSEREPQSVVLVRADGISAWASPAAGDAAIAAAAEPEKLLELPRGGSLDALDAGLRRVCSTGQRCARVTLYFEERLDGRELVRVLESLERSRAGGTASAAIRLALPMPPPLGDEARAFAPRDPASGRLPIGVIRQVVRGSYGFFLACFEGGLSRHPKLAGQANLRFSIERDGSVDDVVDIGGDFPDEEVTQCVMQGFRSLRFPAPSGGRMTVQYPIVLRPG
ncbi:MAG TPA: AgmX/PglI C-terminal domain-containing protein [Polyangiaceae bacterium]|nr:AgmX/PglI C-terminal domain-containing protein [Polyangiaceae bacterium]